MKIIPSVNCINNACVENRLRTINVLDCEWIHVDIAEKGFAQASTWDEPEKFQEMLKKFCQRKIRFEVHIMANNTLERAEKWMEAGAERVIVHPELVDLDALGAILHECEIGLSVAPSAKPESIENHEKFASFIQILSVSPGFSGQIFEPSALFRIKFLRERFPSATIEIDGGITPLIIKEIKKAGADIAVSGSYIFGSENPIQRYKELEAA